MSGLAMMGSWDWSAVYLTCFGVGLVLSLVSFFGGALHVHVGRFHLGGHGGHGHAVKGHGVRGSVSPLNGFTVMAFLCWFGGTGYLLHRANIFGTAVVLMFSALSGLAGGSLVFWFLVSVLMPGERTLEAEDTEMTGVIGRLSGAIPRHGVGEILYSQNGARKSAAVRADNGEAIERGVEVIVMRYARGMGYVKRWDEFEHALMADAPERSEGTREKTRE
jgi:hypothetical protein